MHPRIKRGITLAGALTEPIVFDVALLLLAGWLFSLPWREWADFSTANSSLPHAALLVALLVLNHITRGRYDAPQFRDILSREVCLAGWGLAMLTSASVLMALFASTTRFADANTFSLITPKLLIASLLPIITAALLEEFIHRRVVLGCLARLRTPLILALALQAFLFVLAHGKGSLSSPDRFCWLFTGGLLLGTIYVATRALWPAVLCHGLMNLCLAQTHPRWNWYTQRAVEEIPADWTEPLMPIWLTAILVYWIWRARRDGWRLLPRVFPSVRLR